MKARIFNIMQYEKHPEKWAKKFFSKNCVFSGFWLFCNFLNIQKSLYLCGFSLTRRHRQGLVVVSVVQLWFLW